MIKTEKPIVAWKDMLIMNKRLITSSTGITLPELLVSLAIVSIISVMIIGYLIAGMNNYRKVNEEIALHDEANYVMSEFINYIFVATKVEEQNPNKMIKVTNRENEETIIGFNSNNQAVVNGKPIHPLNYKFTNVPDGDPMLQIDGDKVKIKIQIEDTNSKYHKKLVLESDVSFVEVLD